MANKNDIKFGMNVEKCVKTKVIVYTIEKMRLLGLDLPRIWIRKSLNSGVNWVTGIGHPDIYFQSKTMFRIPGCKVFEICNPSPLWTEKPNSWWGLVGGFQSWLFKFGYEKYKEEIIYFPYFD